jgi:hypothetical protein
MANSEFLNFFQNWLVHAKGHFTSTEQLVVIAEDEAAYEPLEALAKISPIPYKIANKEDHQGFMLLRKVKVSPPWKSEGYSALMRETPDHILRYLKKGCTVLYADIDTAWVKSPFDEIQKAGKHELYFTDDSKDPATMESDNWMACGCFLYMDPTPGVVQLVKSWSDGVQGKSRNQLALNEALRTSLKSLNPVDMTMLPHDKFPPGRLANLNPHATIYHANWISGFTKKIKFFLNRKLWHPKLSAPELM